MTIQAPALASFLSMPGFQTPNPYVAALQMQLRAAGIDPGPVDGVLGEQTLMALYNLSRWTPGVDRAYGAARGAGVELPDMGNRPLTRAERQRVFEQYDSYDAKPMTQAERQRIAQASVDAASQAPATPQQERLRADLDATRALVNTGARVALGKNGQLDIKGTSGADRIQLVRDGDRIRASVTDLATGKVLASQVFDAKKVKGVSIDAGDGNDVVENGNATQRGVDKARIKSGGGQNAIFNNADDVKIAGDAKTPFYAAGDAILNLGKRADIQGSGGADLIVNKGDGGKISAKGPNDVVILTGKNTDVDLGAHGSAVSNGQNNLRGVKENVISDANLSGALAAEVEQNAHVIRGQLDARQQPVVTVRPRPATPAPRAPTPAPRLQLIPHETGPSGPLAPKRDVLIA